MPPSAAAAMAQSPRSLHTLISFGRGADDDEATPASVDVGDAEGAELDFDFDLDFAFAPPVRVESNPLHSPPVMPPSAAAAMAQSPRSLHTLISFGRGADDDEATPASVDVGDAEGAELDFDFDLDFAFAPPVSAAELAPADDIFAHGRIVPAYPVFDRSLLDLSPGDAAEPASTAAPSADTYCAWTPRSAPGSPGRDRFPKSASTGGESSSSSRRWRLRDLVGAGGRSRSDGKDKFAFLHHHHAAAAPPSSKLKTPAAQQKKQSAVKTKPAAKKGVVTEMDMATAHKLFYSKAGAGAGAAGDRRPQQASYLTYRPAFSGLFALGRSQHHTAY
uniref:Uncharacterized protein n=1 Tax=Oryza meridionalis TaxID=40149 RepID=A0A0E0CF34_9ORYZ